MPLLALALFPPINFSFSIRMTEPPRSRTVGAAVVRKAPSNNDRVRGLDGAPRDAELSAVATGDKVASG